jgi:hypothetical protein
VPFRNVIRVASRVVPPGSAAQLACARIAVAATILLLPEVRNPRAFVGMPPALRVAPEGLGWFVALAPIDRTTATLVQAACIASALCAIAGLVARPALIALTASAFYLLALGQLSGAVWHDMHLLWMAALLASSPCDEALAFDRRGGERPPDSKRYGAPLFFARLLLACVYFFPGVHKLASAGWAWALSDNLRNQMWWKWAEAGTIPALRLDRFPGLLHGAGLAVMAFELSFPVLALTRAGRTWAAISGFVFHMLAQAVFAIPFASLWLLYVVFIDPERILVWWRRRTSAKEAPPAAESLAPAGPTMPVLMTGITLFAAVAIQGVRGQMRAFPFACYPTFQWIAGTEMPDLILEAEAQDGTRRVVPHARDARGHRSQRQWGQIWSLAGVTSPVDDARLHAYLDGVRRRDPARSLLRDAIRARFYRAFVSVVPEDADRPPRRGPLLAEFTFPEPVPSHAQGDPLAQ